jgi:predicted branched-subunit amino acid permease
VRALLADPSFRRGFRTGLPVSVAGFALALSFGVLARPVVGAAGAIVMSAIVFAGSAQFGSIAVLAAGGGPVAAIAAGALLNSRYVPMGLALAPSLWGGRMRRVLVSQTMVDFSWAAAMRGGGRFDTRFMVGATVPMYLTWVAGTATGVYAGELLGDPGRLGFDAMFPAFFLGLLLGGEAGSSHLALAAALLGGAIGLALVPLTPPGVPVVAACLAALIGLRERRRPDPEQPETAEQERNAAVPEVG